MENEIIRKRTANPFWHKNTIVIQKSEKMKQSEFLRKLPELGYQKTIGIVHRGTFKHLGSDIIVFPINKAVPFTIEFSGSEIASMSEHRAIEQSREAVL